MSRKTDEREIGELKVTTVQLPAMRGSRLRLKLLRLIAPVLSAFKGKKIEKVEDLLALDMADVAPSIMGMLGQIDDAAHDALALELLVCTSVTRDDGNGKLVKFDLTTKAMIDTAFGSDVDSLWGAMRASIEVNLGGFFAGRGGSPLPAEATPSS